MKRIVSLLLAVAMSVSAVPTAFAADTQDYSLGTQVVFTAANNENYTITVPASLNPGQSGTVTLEGYWPDSKTVTVTAEKTVTLKNSIKAADTKTLNVTFLGISEAGSNTSKQTFTEPVSVEGISNALFGTWSGKFNYNVDSVEEEVPPAENYIGTVSADNTITLSGVESAGTYTLRYANANGALENYADICSLEVTDPATAVSYDDLIAENCAPVEATSIAVYNASNEKVGDIALGGLNPNLGTKLYSFGALADIHIGHEKSYSRTRNALTYLTETEGVDFVCIPGDLTETASDANFASLKAIIDGCSVPVYVSTGNHDTPGYRGTDDITNEFIESYTGNPHYYSFTQGNDVFIMVGLRTDQSGNLFFNGELEWLYETLEANKDKRCFVFQHVFPYDEGCGNAGNFYDFDIWGGYDEISFESLMERYTNAIFFHGHSHTVFEGQTIDDAANYSNSLGSHSVHIPSVTNPRALTGNYDSSMSQGWAIDVYENGVALKGIDFVNNQYLPIGQYYLGNQAITNQTNVTIPLNIDYQFGIKLSKTDNTFTEVSYDNSSAKETYWASQYIPYDNNALYRVGFAIDSTQKVSICYYDQNQNLINYNADILNGQEDRSIRSVEIPSVDGAAYIRLRAWCYVEPSYPITYSASAVCIAKQFSAN